LRPKLPQLASPVSSAAVESGKQAIREAIEHWPVLFDSPVAVTLVSPDVVDCSNQAPLLLTVRYRFFTTKIPLAVSRTFEARSAASADPGRALAARPERRLEITPNLGYNRAEQTFLGGRVAIAAPRYFNRIVAEGYASPRASRASLAAEGGTDRPEASIARVDWRIGYQYADQPTNRGPMRDARLAAQLTLTGKPNDASGVLLRYAASLEAGTQRSDFASNSAACPIPVSSPIPNTSPISLTTPASRRYKLNRVSTRAFCFAMAQRPTTSASSAAAHRRPSSGPPIGASKSTRSSGQSPTFGSTPTALPPTT